MRVISGIVRGFTLKVTGTARPYLEKTRGAIFNTLCADVPEADVLDLYAGSGAVGIEALSRGARRCVFVEADRATAATVQENLQKCKFTDHAQVLTMRAAAYAQSSREVFDLIFIDPPFDDNPGWPQSPEAQSLMRHAARLLAADGRLIFRFEHQRLDPPVWQGLQLQNDRRYGRSRVLFYIPQSAGGQQPQPEQG